MNTKSAWRREPAANTSKGSFVALDLREGMLRGRVDVSRPNQGLMELAWRGALLPQWRLLAPELSKTGHAPLSLTDCYIRGLDLIVSYVDEAEKLGREIYWRGLESSTAVATVAGVELIVSAQTSLLDSQPQLEITSRLSRGELGRMAPGEEFAFFRDTAGRQEFKPSDGPGLFLFRPDGAGFSYAEMIYPSDFQHAGLAVEPDGVAITHLLFPDSLEKGVIRRGRVRGWFLDRRNDTVAAAELYRDWLSEPPPLTT